MNDFNVEPPENYEPKCCLAIVVDVSESMNGAPILELSAGLQQFHKDIASDSTTADRLEVTLITFNHTINTLIEHSLVENFSMPQLEVSGSTKMVDGVRAGLEAVRYRKQYYKQTGQPYYRPWVLLITDGAPDPDQDVNGLAGEIKQAVDRKELMFFAIGVENADMKVLNHLSGTARPAAKLQGLKFSEFFKWLSRSMQIVSASKTGDTVTMANPSDWMKPQTV